jgi:CHAT domain-containing protein/tetratricopeptide (TPR) repeat protein
MKTSNHPKNMKSTITMIAALLLIILCTGIVWGGIKMIQTLGWAWAVLIVVICAAVFFWALRALGKRIRQNSAGISEGNKKDKKFSHVIEKNIDQAKNFETSDQSIEQVQPELFEIAASLKQRGVELRTEEDLLRALDDHPDLGDKFIELITRTLTDENANIPAEFKLAQQIRQPSEKYFQRNQEQESFKQSVAKIPPELQEVFEELAKSGIDIRSENDFLLALKSQPDLYKKVTDTSQVFWDQSDIPQRILMCEQTLKLIDRFAQPKLWASVKNDLATSLIQSQIGDRVDNLEQAIQHYQQVLEVYTRQSYPEGWAGVQHNLGRAYSRRIQGERAENLEQTIHYYQQALEVYTRQSYSEDWAMIQNNLGLAYSHRIRGKRAENLEQSIHHYQCALEVYTHQDYPEDWAMIQNNLGLVYSRRIQGERAENLEQAIHHCQQALKVRTRRVYPEEWAGAQANLGLAYYERIRGERAENLEKAIHCYQQALEVFDDEDYPEQWAMIQNNLGRAYSYRIQDERAGNLEQAIHHCQQALEVYTRQAYPEDWAMTQNNLANAYSQRIQGERAENLEQAIHCYQQVLEVYTRQAYPEDWAMTQNNLAVAYSLRIQGERAENLEQAIHHYQQALEVKTRPAYPEDWAMTQNNLANVYSHRIRGERAENLEQSIHHYQQALKVRTRQAHPEDWATTQNNLAVAYSHRIQGERAENLEQSIRYYQQVLQVYTRQAYPEDWAMTQDNLASAYFQRIQGERAKNLEQSIHHYQQALKVYTRQSYPEQWAGTQNNLANVYADRIRGERAENLKHSIYHFQQALEVYTLHAYPIECRLAARNLGDLGFELLNWDWTIEGYELALKAQESILGACTLRVNKEAELRETRNLPARAAYAHAKNGALSVSVETIESGRARLLGESLERARRDLELLADPAVGKAELLERYRTASEHYNALLQPAANLPEPLPPANRLHQMETAQVELEAVIADIRRVPGYETFLIPPTVEQIQQQAGDAPLVYLIVTPAGGFALIVTPSDIFPVDLPALTEDALRTRVIGEKSHSTYWRAYWDWRTDPYNKSKRKVWEQALDTTTCWLWDTLMQPVIARLREIAMPGSQIVLIPSDWLSLLPLHAAWAADTSQLCGRRYALDAFTFTYAPSSLALIHARSQAEKVSAEKLLIVENPDDTLHFSEIATLGAQTLFDSVTHLPRKSATFESVQEMFESHNTLYFFTHGIARFDEPLQSALTLADKSLTLNEIFSLKTDAVRLAVLSSCESGVPSNLDLLDEAVSLPSGLMQAGVPGVISSQWIVLESSTAVLMSVFFKQWRREGLSVPQALRKAQIILRDAEFDEDAKAYVKASLPDNAMLSIDVDDILKSIKFAHPFYWAAFTFTGL